MKVGKVKVVKKIGNKLVIVDVNPKGLLLLCNCFSCKKVMFNQLKGGNMR